MSRVRNYVALALLSNLCLGILFFSSGTAQTETLEWSRPIPISGALGGSRYPSIIADDRGRVYLFWGTGQSGEGNTIFISQFDGSVWLRPVDVLLGGPRSLGLLDGRGIIHMQVPQGATISLVNADAQAAMSARGWDGGVEVTRPGGGEMGDMLIDRAGALYTVWFQKVEGCENCFSIAYQEFQEQTDLSLTYRVLSDFADSPQRRLQLAGDPSTTMYAMWDRAATDSSKAGIGLSVSKNGGETWSEEPIELRYEEEDILQPLLFVDTNGTLVLVYNFGVKDETYYSTSTDEGVTWSTPQPIPGLFANRESAQDDYFAAATDSTGLVHVIAAGRASKSQVEAGLYHIIWDGTAWNNLQEMYHANTTVEYPSISLSNRNRLHVSFATKDRNPVGSSASDTSQVWYTTALTDAPAQTRVPLPTFTATPSMTPSPQATPLPTQTPNPTPIPAEDLNRSPDPSTADPQLPVVIALGTVVLLLAVVIVVNTLIRRRS